MQKTRKLISMLLAVMMVLSMCTVGMFSASALPEDAIINDVEGDASGIDGDVYGLMGDADANDKINVKDATQIQKFAAKLITLDEKCEALADVNLDDKVNVKDATAIQKWVAKYDVEEPINCVVYIPAVPTTVATEPTTIVVEPESTPDEPATTAAPVETKPSVPVIVVPTTVATEPTEAPTTEAKPTEAPTTEAKPTEAPTTEAKPTEVITTTEAKVTEAPADDVTVYFQNNWLWTNVSAHMWTANGDLTTWPGTAMTFVENDGNYDIYSVVVPADVTGIVITGNKDTAPNDLDKTPDILEWHDGQCFYMVWDETISGNNVGSFEYVTPTEPTTTKAESTTVADDTTTADDTTAADTTAADVTETQPDTDATDATEATTVAEDDGMVTIYFTNNKDWAGVYMYAFYGVVGGETTGKPLGDYPGTAMTYVRDNSQGQPIYKIDVPADVDYIKFCDGTGDSPNHRTDNIPNDRFDDGMGFYLLDKGDAKYWPYETYEYGEGSDEDETTTAEDVTTVVDTSEVETAPDSQPETSEAADDDEMITIYFTNNKDWADAYMYAFYGVVGGETTGKPLGDYPGTKMTYVRDNSQGQPIYKIEVPADIDYIKFCDGTGDSPNNRTDNIPNSVLADNIGFYLLDKGEKYWPYETYEYGEGSDEEDTTATEEITTSEATEPSSEATQPTTETKPEDPEPTAIKVYAINSAKWTEMYTHFWGGVTGTTWPGKAMTKTGETVNGFDVYEYTFEAAPQNIIFNNNDKGSQTADLTFQAGKYFDVKGGKWYDSLDDVPAVSASATDRYLVGSFNGWNTTANEFMSADGKVGRVEMELAANTAYEFKIVREGTWTSCKDTLSITSSASGLTFSSSVSGNTKLTTKAAGTYVFEFDLSTSQLTVTYP